MILLGLLLSTAAHAADISAGVLTNVNDPFVRRNALAVHGRHHLTPTISVGGLVDFAPDRGSDDWRPLTTQLVEENSVSPDISKTSWTVALPLGIDPLRTDLGPASTATQVYMGPAMMRTVDDLEALQAVGDPRAEATQFQTHVGVVWGLTTDILWPGNIGARFRLHRATHIETVNATTLQMKSNFMLGFEVLMLLSKPPSGAGGPAAGGA